MFFIKVPPANKALLISGGRVKDKRPFRVVVGGRAVVFPIVHRASMLDLSQQQARISERCLSLEKFPLDVEATIAFRIPNDPDAIIEAAMQFLDDKGAKMTDYVSQIALGHLRGIVGAMPLEEIISKRASLATEALDASKRELIEQGLNVVSFQITSLRGVPIDEVANRGDIITTMAMPAVAQLQQQASVAQSRSQQAAAQAAQESARNQAAYERETAVAKAGFMADQQAAEAEASQKAQVAQAAAGQEARVAQARAQQAINEADARAAQAGPLAQAQASQEVTAEQTKLALLSVEQRTAELERDVIKPAEAAKRQRIAAAQAEAEATKLAAGAAAAEGKISLEQLWIENFPAMMTAAASQLHGARVTLLNGSDGLAELFTGLAAQVGRLYEVARSSTTSVSNGHHAHSNGSSADVPEENLLAEGPVR